jgi:hypothetical protein
MNYLITESQSKILQRELKRSIEEIGVWKTRKRFKLNHEQLFHLLGDDLPDLSCEDYYDIIYDIFIGGKVKKRYNIGRYRLSLYLDNMVGAINFRCVDVLNGDEITGYATPYWDGECQLPLELSWYTYQDEDGNPQETELVGEFSEYEVLDNKFNEVSEIIDWFNTEYMKILSEYCDNAFDHVRYL